MKSRPSMVGAAELERSVLIVDDEASIRDSVGRYLTARGFQVQSADTVAAALERLRETRFAALVCDVRMPAASGMELVPAAHRHDPDLAILMLTGVNDATAATEALALGAMDYLLKPIELGELEHALIGALRRRNERRERRDLEQAVRDEAVRRAVHLERERVTLNAATIVALETIVAFSEAKDPYRAGHSQRVAEVAAMIAAEMQLDAETTANVHLAGRLHDIGMLAIPEAALLKPGPLTAAEYHVVHTHVEVGVNMLAPVPACEPVIRFVQDHQERWDGGGYPAGLQGESISLGGRILAVADAFVAVTAGRPYFAALPGAEAVAFLATLTGTQLDAQVFRSLERIAGQQHDQTPMAQSP